jgi:hypothetical protein
MNPGIVLSWPDNVPKRNELSVNTCTICLGHSAASPATVQRHCCSSVSAQVRHPPAGRAPERYCQSTAALARHTQALVKSRARRRHGHVARARCSRDGQQVRAGQHDDGGAEQAQRAERGDGARGRGRARGRRPLAVREVAPPPAQPGGRVVALCVLRTASRRSGLTVHWQRDPAESTGCTRSAAHALSRAV